MRALKICAAFSISLAVLMALWWNVNPVLIYIGAIETLIERREPEVVVGNLVLFSPVLCGFGIIFKKMWERRSF
jgi:hypothetical protein